MGLRKTSSPGRHVGAFEGRPAGPAGEPSMSMSRSAQGLRRVQFVHERTPGRSQPFT